MNHTNLSHEGSETNNTQRSRKQPGDRCTFTPSTVEIIFLEILVTIAVISVGLLISVVMSEQPPSQNDNLQT